MTQVSQEDGPTSHYAVLGERSRDAPSILPAEQAVMYTTVRSNEGSRRNTIKNIQVHLHLYQYNV